jgi:hypothetical protein
MTNSAHSRGFKHEGPAARLRVLEEHREEPGEKIESAVRNGAAYSNDNGPAGALEYPLTQLLN